MPVGAAHDPPRTAARLGDPRDEALLVRVMVRVRLMVRVRVRVRVSHATKLSGSRSVAESATICTVLGRCMRVSSHTVPRSTSLI